ncbi:hypothetical protein ABW20_dc0106322 [Dactylellina cionopaga]|nr:hypothetical protein ABW20_dc0106322 [Dactylellina cionopaga]
MWEDKKINLFYASPGNTGAQLSELIIDIKGSVSTGSFGLPYRKFHTEGQVGVTSFHRDGVENFRTWGAEGSNVLLDDSRAEQVDPESTIAVVNLHPWSWNSPSLRVYYITRTGHLRELAWEEGGWRKGDLNVKVDPKARITATCSVAEKGSQGNIFAKPKQLLYWVENDELHVMVKGDDEAWVTGEKAATGQKGPNISIITIPGGNGHDNVHMITSAGDGKFMHGIMKNGDWDMKTYDPSTAANAAPRKEDPENKQPDVIPP